MHEHLPEHRLTGGLRLAAAKEASTRNPIRRGFVPQTVIIGLHQAHGTAATPVVAPGDQVLRGQIIATGTAPTGTHVHASTSGRVVAIDARQVPTSAGVETRPCITIAADGRNEPATAADWQWPDSRAARLEQIAAAGIVGLGGATYPTAAKLAGRESRMLIVNGAECEPYIACDDMLMREAAADIVAGAASMAEIIGAAVTVIAIERDKPEAIAAIRAAVVARGDPAIRVTELPTIYPAGGERQLIDVVAGVEVPSGRFPGEIGFVCQNVGTAHAVARLAASGQPLTSRIVTVTGGAIREPGNVEVPIGTPIAELLDHCGGCSMPPALLVHGGSMMGYELPSAQLPVTKATNCLIVAAPGELKRPVPEWPCIRCGECAIACPARLQPQDLLLAAHSGDVDSLAALGLADCIECGCCDVVCPSNIPLTSRFHAARQVLEHALALAELSAASAERFRQHEARAHAAAAEEQQLQTTLKRQIDDPDARRAAIAAAVDRSRRRRSQDSDD